MEVSMKKTLIVCLLLCTLATTATTFAKKKSKPAPPAPAPTKLNLVWQADVPGANADLNQQPKLPGVNVVSPCWFDIATAHGIIRDKVQNKAYVNNMHKKGYQVWPLITNSFNPALTSILLNNPEGQENLKNNMLALALKYKFDGFNLDFENIADQDRDKLTALVKDIAAALRAHQLKVSMDVTTPSNTPYWSNCYDRKALAQEVDYLMLMAYDQHHPTMKRAGSTASLNWVQRGIETTLKEVPSEKLVLGLPLYARLWESNIGSRQAKGKTISMTAMEDLIVQEKITPVWKQEAGQNYLSYTKENKLYQVWQENAASLRAKVNLVHQYELAGIASWRKGFETSDIWPVLNEALLKAGAV